MPLHRYRLREVSTYPSKGAATRAGAASHERERMTKGRMAFWRGETIKRGHVRIIAYRRRLGKVCLPNSLDGIRINAGCTRDH
jgi:hypothetical protein